MADRTTYAEGSQHSAAERVQIAVGNVEQIRNRLALIPETLGGAWMGEAATVYTQVLNEWTPQFTKVIEALARIGENLKATDVQYTEASTSASEVAARLRSSLNGGAI
ncbi:WXG100 family type VII secretion target [Nonomuraea fuscirosea]|uniref:ESAT-6-like protein n=1 Tax=Nonomuraea fuscirosea TaxID=1291556 RepID=A0A2T0N9Y5_9ACTN|nr:WXG100 family type VII secretion target [Nonomuraea fuscirosea]PRX69563.1 WXG100 family type VII secretion target [Nonomuraea fuscirosea]WSA48964.1 WXG100 family type VII secretion target [Nonomuraea fuscirosea]